MENKKNSIRSKETTELAKDDSVFKSGLVEIHKTKIKTEVQLDLTCQHCGTRFEFKFKDELENPKLRLPIIDPRAIFLSEEE